MARRRRQFNSARRSLDFPNSLWVIIFLAMIALYFFGLNFVPLLGPDEPRYAQVAREMFERNDWITPTLGGANWFEKPALLYWLIDVAYRIFGVNEFATRVFSAACGLLCVLVLYRLGKRVENLIQTKGGWATRNVNDLGKFIALTFGTSIGLIVFSRAATFDIILMTAVTLSLACYFIFDLYVPYSRREEDFHEYYITDLGYLALFYVFIGVALLAKGLIGFVLPFGTLFLYWAIQFRFPPKMFIYSIFWGIPLCLLVACSWYLPMYLQHGQSFIDEFFVQHHFQRYISNQFQHPQPFYFFWWVLPVMTLPWLPFFVMSLVDIKYWRWGEAQMQHDRLRVFAFAWMLFPLFFFTFSGSKLPGYILPALPGAMILVGDQIRRYTHERKERNWLIFGLSSGTLLVVFLALFFFVQGFARNETVKYLMETANAKGFATARVLNLHTQSHSAEYYADKRIIRDADGKIRKFLGVEEVVEELKKNGSPALVLVPNEYLPKSLESDEMNMEILGENGELAIAVVALKK